MKSNIEWLEKSGSLVKEFEMINFDQIIDCLIQLNKILQISNHHPNFKVFDYKKIRFELSTHDENNSVTPKDYELARAIDLIFSSK